MIIKDCRITMIFINVDYRKSRKSCESWFRQKKNVLTLIMKDCRIPMILYTWIQENQVIKKIK